MSEEFEADPVEHLLEVTRERSVASSRYEFAFFDGYERAVVPVIYQPSGGRPRLVGTGFFILPWGLFVSAKHVFEGPDIHEEDSFDVMVDNGGSTKQIPVTEIFVHNSIDIAFGVVEIGGDVPIVSVMHNDPIICDQGVEPLGAFVFAHTLVKEFKPFDQEQVMFSFRSHWEKGYIEEVHLDGCRLVKGRCFSTSIFAEGRSSGAPVFNSNGFVIGLINTGLAPKDKCPISTVASISEVLRVTVNDKTVWDQRKDYPNRPTVRVTRNPQAFDLDN